MDYTESKPSESIPTDALKKVANVISVDQQQLGIFCRKNEIVRLALFGSYLKGTARSDSDVDLLVEFAPHARPTFFDMAGMEEELSLLFGGRRIDLRTSQEISRLFRDDVLKEARVQYGA